MILHESPGQSTRSCGPGTGEGRAWHVPRPAARHSRFSHQPYLRRQPESVSLIAAGAAIDRKGAPGGPPDAAVIGFFWWSAHEKTDQRSAGRGARIAGRTRRRACGHPPGPLRPVVRRAGGRAGHRAKSGIISGGGSGHEPHARGLRGQRHARCRVSGPGLHVAYARPDGGGDARGRWRRRASCTSSRTTPATS